MLVAVAALPSLAVLAGRYVFHPARDGAVAIRVRVGSEAAGAADAQVTARAAEVLMRRLRSAGIRDPRAQVEAPGTIRIEAPGPDDAERCLPLLSRRSRLELRLVEAGPAPSEGLLSSFAGVAPDGTEVLSDTNAVTEEAPRYLVSRSVVVGNEDLQDVHGSQDHLGRPMVSFRLTADGAARMGKATRENVGRSLAIVLDGRVQSAPRIVGEIGASGEITGTFTRQEVDDLVVVLGSGVLPAPVEVLETTPISGGPWLRQLEIGIGVVATLLAASLVASVALVIHLWRRRVAARALA